jgi:superfamily II DNA or RNA helicase
MLEDDGDITPVEVVLVPTDFRADWYAAAEPGDRDWNRLMDEMTTDPARNALLVDVIRRATRAGSVLAFSHRIAHATDIADRELFAAGVRSGLLLGGDDNAVRFEEDKARLKAGELPVCCGTYNAVGVGIDMPAVRAGVMLTPVGNNRQFFGQVRGRVCRKAPGKTMGTLFVLWDRHVMPRLAKNVEAWNRGRTRTMDEDELEELRRAP